MKASLIDTNILSLFLRGHSPTVDKFDAYLQEYNTIHFSIITYYEIVSGLKHRDAHKQLNSFLNLASQSTILLAADNECCRRCGSDICRFAEKRTANR